MAYTDSHTVELDRSPSCGGQEAGTEACILPPASAGADSVTVFEPIRWCGWFEDEDGSRWLVFKSVDGLRQTITATEALANGMFDWDTTTPERRDILQPWATDPTMASPSARALAA